MPILSSNKKFIVFYIFKGKSLIRHYLSLGFLLSQTFAFDCLLGFLLYCFLLDFICCFWLHFWLDLLLFYIDFSETVLDWVQMMLLSWNLHILFATLPRFIVFSSIEIFGFLPLFLALFRRVSYQIFIRSHIVLIWRHLEIFLFRPKFCLWKIFHQLDWILCQIFRPLVQRYLTFDLAQKIRFIYVVQCRMWTVFILCLIQVLRMKILWTIFCEWFFFLRFNRMLWLWFVAWDFSSGLFLWLNVL